MPARRVCFMPGITHKRGTVLTAALNVGRYNSPQLGRSRPKPFRSGSVASPRMAVRPQQATPSGWAAPYPSHMLPDA